jgi:hypothetical protein
MGKGLPLEPDLTCAPRATHPGARVQINEVPEAVVLAARMTVTVQIDPQFQTGNLNDRQCGAEKDVAALGQMDHKEMSACGIEGRSDHYGTCHLIDVERTVM